MATWTTATRTWAAGETLTAANMNAQIRDFANGFGAWNSYTPTLTQSAAVTKTVNYAKYIQIQKTVICNVYLSVTAAGTTANAITVTLPVAAASVGPSVGSASVFRTGTGMYVCQAVTYSATNTVAFINDTSGVSYVGAAPSYALANGDVIRFSVSYETA